MFKHLRILSVGTLGLLGHFVFAQEVSKTSLEDWLRMTLEKNPEIIVFEKKYQAAQQKIPQVSSLPDPKLQYSEFIESVQTRTGSQERVLGLNQSFPWFGSLNLKETQATHEAKAIWYAYHFKILDTTRTAADLYIEIGFTHQATKLTEENLSLLKGLEPIIEDKVAAGADLNGLLRLKVEMGTVEDKLRSLQTKQKTLQAKLSALAALPAGHSLSPIWNNEHPMLHGSNSSFALADQVEANNPLILMLKEKLESESVRRELAKLDFYPEFSVGINYIQVDRQTGLNPVGAGKDPWSVNLAISLPIYRDKYRAREQEAVFSQEAAEHELENAILKLNSGLEVGLTQYEDAVRRTQLYGSDLLSLAEQALENSKISYQSDRTSVLEVIDSERSLLDLKLLHARAIADTWQQYIVIQTVLNKPITQ